jgi:hypothetical protein
MARTNLLTGEDAEICSMQDRATNKIENLSAERPIPLSAFPQFGKGTIGERKKTAPLRLTRVVVYAGRFFKYFIFSGRPKSVK